MENKEERNKIWLDENGIINVKLAKEITESELIDLFKEGERIANSVFDKFSILIMIDITSGLIIMSSKLRKFVVEHVKELAKNIGFKKIAVFGSVGPRVVTSFLISAAGIKNTKVFETKEEALFWLLE